MTLREVGLQIIPHRGHATTFKEAVDTLDGDFMRMYELMAVPYVRC